MNYILLAFVALMTGIYQLVNKQATLHNIKNVPSFLVYYSSWTGLVGIFLTIYLLVTQKTINIEKMTIILGLLMGLIGIISTYTLLQLIKHGPLSMATIALTLGGLILPIIYGTFFLDEGFKPVQGIGFIFVILCFLFFSKPDETHKKISLTWVILVSIIVCLSGSYNVIMKYHQVVLFQGTQTLEFVIVIFLSASLFGLSILAGMGLTHKLKKEQFEKIRSKKLVIMIVIYSFFATFSNALVTELAGKMPAIIQFPVQNIGAILVATFGSIIIFKERLSNRNIYGIIFGILAVLFLCI